MLYDAVAIGKRIADERKKKGMTQEAMAEGLAIATSTLGKIERGKQAVSVELLLSVAVFLEISTDYMFFGSQFHTEKMDNHIQNMMDELMRMRDELQNLTNGGR